MAAGGRRHLASTSVDTWTPLKQKKCRREVSTPSVQLKNSSKTAPRRAVDKNSENKAFRTSTPRVDTSKCRGPKCRRQVSSFPAVAPLRRWWLIKSRHPVLDRIRARTVPSVWYNAMGYQTARARRALAPSSCASRSYGAARLERAVARNQAKPLYGRQPAPLTASGLRSVGPDRPIC